MTRVSGRHYAVEEVNSAVYAFDNVLRCSHSHEVSRLVLRHIRLYGFDYAIHFLGFFTYSKSAYSVSVGVKLAYLLHVADSEVGVCASLIDSEQHLVRVDSVFKSVQSVKLCLAAEKPACGSVAGVFNVVVFGGVLYAFIKRHRYG